jgi:hypothetical protein
MNDQQRKACTAKLWELRHSDPAAVLHAYRRVVNLNLTDPLPSGVTFVQMIEAIVNNAAAEGRKQAAPTVRQ